MQHGDEHYRFLFEQMLSGIAYCQVLTDEAAPHDFVYLEVNPAFEAQTGLADVVGQRVSNVIPGLREADAWLLDLCSEVATTGVPRHVERYLHSLRRRFSISVYSPKKDHFIAVFDVKAEGAPETEARLRSIVTAMSEGVVMQDARGAIVSCNPAAERVLGLSFEQMSGRTSVDPRWCSVRADGSAFPGNEHPSMVTLRTGDPLTGVVMGVHKPDGSLTWISISSAPVRLAAGAAPHAVVTTFTDITASKEIERRLEEANRRLGDRVSEAVDGLRAKDKLLITQSRQAAMGEMLSNIAHQWRQPLNALSLVLANLVDSSRFGELDANALEGAMSDANRLIQQMSGTINDFRNFVEPTKERRAFAAVDQVREAIDLVEASFLHAGITIEVEAVDDVTLFGFANEYSQVLLNVLANARQAIEERDGEHGRIVVRVSRRDGLGCVTVRDNGGGIPGDVLDRMFEPYFSTKPSGTGIGLYMSRQIAEQSLGGRLEGTNVDGGAEFTLLTPLADGPGLEEATHD